MRNIFRLVITDEKQDTECQTHSITLQFIFFLPINRQYSSGFSSQGSNVHARNSLANKDDWSWSNVMAKCCFYHFLTYGYGFYCSPCHGLSTDRVISCAYAGHERGSVKLKVIWECCQLTFCGEGDCKKQRWEMVILVICWGLTSSLNDLSV